jgi:hypothetical protein
MKIERDGTVKLARAHGKGCIGCKVANRDVMLSFQETGVVGIRDLYLSQGQAEQLHAELGDRIKQNEE